MKRNMCVLCRFLHDSIVFRNLSLWGTCPSPLSGCASMRVYVPGAADGWILLRSYLGFCYVHTDFDESIQDTSIIKVVDIPCRKSPYYVVYTCTWILEPSVYLSGVTSYCRRLLQRLAFSELCHFSRDNDPANTMAYDKTRSVIY